MRKAQPTRSIAYELRYDTQLASLYCMRAQSLCAKGFAASALRTMKSTVFTWQTLDALNLSLCLRGLNGQRLMAVE